MGEFLLSDNQRFMAQQIENSVKIIETFFDSKELSYTALQNALLSLVLLPFESAKKKDKIRVWRGSYSDIKKEIGFSEIVFQPIAECRNQTPKFNNRSQYSFIKKFRNAVAHQNIQIVVREDRVITVEFFNISPSKCKKCKTSDCKAKSLKATVNGVEDFRISFTYNQLHTFAIYVANSYLKSITGKGLQERNNENG